jgi:hypothetical protein
VALPAAACPSYDFVSERAGEVWSQSYRYGSPIGPAKMLGTTDTTGTTETTGTTITFEAAEPIEYAAIGTLVDALVSRISGLVVTLRI